MYSSRIGGSASQFLRIVCNCKVIFNPLTRQLTSQYWGTTTANGGDSAISMFNSLSVLDYLESPYLIALVFKRKVMRTDVRVLEQVDEFVCF